jgi:hypothetical protein
MERQPTIDGQQRVYVSRRRQLLLAAGLLAVFLATLSLVLEPDPETGIKPLPGDYLWVVIPGTIVLLVLVWRAMKARIETDSGGVDLFRVAGHEFVPWADVRGFEVHPTPGRQGSAVRIRRRSEALVTVRSEISVRPARDRDEARRLAKVRAVALRDQLEADRMSRLRSDAKAPSSTDAADSGTAADSASSASSASSAG